MKDTEYNQVIRKGIGETLTWQFTYYSVSGLWTMMGIGGQESGKGGAKSKEDALELANEFADKVIARGK